eukprot:jgi/Mesvir1/26326/Mv22505-RA.2
MTTEETIRTQMDTVLPELDSMRLLDDKHPGGGPAGTAPDGGSGKPPVTLPAAEDVPSPLHPEYRNKLFEKTSPENKEDVLVDLTELERGMGATAAPPIASKSLRVSAELAMTGINDAPADNGHVTTQVNDATMAALERHGKLRSSKVVPTLHLPHDTPPGAQPQDGVGAPLSPTSPGTAALLSRIFGGGLRKSALASGNSSILQGRAPASPSSSLSATSPLSSSLSSMALSSSASSPAVPASSIGSVGSPRSLERVFGASAGSLMGTVNRLNKWRKTAKKHSRTKRYVGTDIHEKMRRWYQRAVFGTLERGQGLPMTAAAKKRLDAQTDSIKTDLPPQIHRLILIEAYPICMQMAKIYAEELGEEHPITIQVKPRPPSTQA